MRHDLREKGERETGLKRWTFNSHKFERLHSRVITYQGERRHRKKERRGANRYGLSTKKENVKGEKCSERTRARKREWARTCNMLAKKALVNVSRRVHKEVRHDELAPTGGTSEPRITPRRGHGQGTRLLPFSHLTLLHTQTSLFHFMASDSAVIQTSCPIGFVSHCAVPSRFSPIFPKPSH